MFLGEAATPPGMRIYAIGDIHGLDETLAGMHARVFADIAARPPADYRMVHAGDYIDRGPDSAGVIERLVRLMEGDPRVVCLRGNHDQMLLDFLDDPVGNASVWYQNGAEATFASYRVEIGSPRTEADVTALGTRFSEALPKEHRAFFENLPFSIQLGDYFFCHAGIGPGVPLIQQSPFDLIWIRQPFLSDHSDHGAVVVHGHTPSAIPDVRRNRINIDTGAVYGGSLTCLVLEGTGYRFL